MARRIAHANVEALSTHTIGVLDLTVIFESETTTTMIDWIFKIAVDHLQINPAGGGGILSLTLISLGIVRTTSLDNCRFCRLSCVTTEAPGASGMCNRIMRTMVQH
jgi:hypothetical protein